MDSPQYDSIHEHHGSYGKDDNLLQPYMRKTDEHRLTGSYAGRCDMPAVYCPRCSVRPHSPHPQPLTRLMHANGT